MQGKTVPKATSPTEQSQSRAKCVPYPGTALLAEAEPWQKAAQEEGTQEQSQNPALSIQHGNFRCQTELLIPEEPEGLSDSQWPPQGQDAFQAGIFCAFKVETHVNRLVNEKNYPIQLCANREV